MSETSGGYELPAYVIDDLDANPGLVRKWAEDGSFRSAVLRSSDPGAVISGAGFSVQPATAAWILERVQAIGLDDLDVSPTFLPM